MKEREKAKNESQRKERKTEKMKEIRRLIVIDGEKRRTINRKRQTEKKEE